MLSCLVHHTSTAAHQHTSTPDHQAAMPPAQQHSSTAGHQATRPLTHPCAPSQELQALTSRQAQLEERAADLQRDLGEMAATSVALLGSTKQQKAALLQARVDRALRLLNKMDAGEMEEGKVGGMWDAGGAVRAFLLLACWPAGPLAVRWSQQWAVDQARRCGVSARRAWWPPCGVLPVLWCGIVVDILPVASDLATSPATLSHTPPRLLLQGLQHPVPPARVCSDIYCCPCNLLMPPLPPPLCRATSAASASSARPSSTRLTWRCCTAAPCLWRHGRGTGR